jgi:RimJ/RimL family protein N-acetyltransferase
MMEVRPVTLQGRYARLEPPSEKHVADLLVAGESADIWPYMLFGPLNGSAEWSALIRTLLERMNKGEIIPFVTVRLSDARAVGMTSYLNIARADYGLEIGSTWLMPEARRTAINTECKHLLLRHAFETLHCIRVQLKTDSRNVTSQRAIERLGAVKEGVLRSHMIVKDGYRRDTVMYSILDTEWPAVKARLEKMLYSPS